jgi:hypothetical protein
MTVAEGRRKSWTQAEVATLVTHFHTKADARAIVGAWGSRSAAEVNAKLTQLGLVAKPQKPRLTEDAHTVVDKAVGSIHHLPEPQRTLALRHAIKSLQAFLPKKGPKSA